MSAASSARSPAAPAAARAPQQPPAAAAKPAKRSGFSFAGADSEDHFKLNLTDIPKVPHTMEVEGFKPSLLGRLVNLVVGSK